MKKLHLGCGLNILNGWENLDKDVDVSKPLPYLNNSVDYVFHEHLIEHLDEVDGYNFMKECYRILKPGGYLRISTPSIEGIIKCYQNWEQVSPEFQQRHGSKTSFINNATLGQTANYIGKRFDPQGKSITLNRGDHWHRFYYDKEDLKYKLTKVGFREVRFVDKQCSDIPQLRNLEGRTSGLFATFPKELEVILEARKKMPSQI